MENLFKQNNNTSDNQDKNLQSTYEKIFMEATDQIREEVNKFKPVDACKSCKIQECKIEKKDVFTEYPMNCPYRNWQLNIITFLSGDYKQKLNLEYKSLMKEKDNYQCNKCGACCKFATNKYSFAQLKQLALKGNKFAKDFVSIYVPYENEEDAKQANLDLYTKLNDIITDNKIYYYYCTKLKNNLCTIYDNRPQICKDFPNNPLKALPAECSYNTWFEKISHQAMLLNAKIDIIEFYKGKLK